ncbi:MAG: ElyC/SanA/YdcF family protein [Syntrophorhabdus sp.]
MKIFAAAIIIIFIFAGVVYYAPNYLVYADLPQKADTIVLFLGNEYRERRAEANRLIAEGYATHLLIPAYGKLAKAPDHRRATRNSVPSRPPGYPVVYEDTHVEILEAKKLMDRNGLKSAIFVSSPHHMRRIKLIADRVFTAKSYQNTYVPTRSEKPRAGIWLFHQSDIKKITSEYGKIIWFFLYRWFK